MIRYYCEYKSDIEKKGKQPKTDNTKVNMATVLAYFLVYRMAHKFFSCFLVYTCQISISLVIQSVSCTIVNQSIIITPCYDYAIVACIHQQAILQPYRAIVACYYLIVIRS